MNGKTASTMYGMMLTDEYRSARKKILTSHFFQ